MDDAIASLRPALSDAAQALSLSLTEPQLDALLTYVALLQRWNSAYNLTAVREPRQMVAQHLADCLAVIGPLRRETKNLPTTALDVGSGGGLPGVVLAIACPELAVTCVDAVGKKAAFVQQVAAELRLRNLKAAHSRVEAMGVEAFDVVTSRAYASLTDFVTLTRHQLRSDGKWMAMKGKTPKDEIAVLPAWTQVFHVEQLTVPGLDAERCLIWMREQA